MRQRDTQDKKEKKEFHIWTGGAGWDFFFSLSLSCDQVFFLTQAHVSNLLTGISSGPVYSLHVC